MNLPVGEACSLAAVHHSDPNQSLVSVRTDGADLKTLRHKTHSFIDFRDVNAVAENFRVINKIYNATVMEVIL